MDDWNDIGGEEFWLRPISRLPNFHHSNPLTYYPQRHIVSRYKGESTVPEIPLFREVINIINDLNKKFKVKHDLTDDPSSLYHIVLSSAVPGSTGFHPEVDDTMLNAVHYCWSELVMDLNSISKVNPGVDFSNLTSRMTITAEREICRNASQGFLLYKQLCCIRNNVQQRSLALSVDDGMKEEVLLGLSVYVVKEILLVKGLNHSSELIIINFDQLLMLTDTVACRLFCLITCDINDVIDQDDIPSANKLAEVYNWGDQLIKSYGLKAFSVIGEFETICTNAFVNYPGYDPLGLGESFFLAIIENAKEQQDITGIPVEETEKLIMILSSLESINQLSEVFGLRKHWGNPMVIADVSGRAVQEKVAEVLPVDPVALINLHASFNRLIVLEFIKKNGKWPDCTISDKLKGTELYCCWSLNTIRINERSSKHNHKHWSMVVFKPNCVVDSYVDQLSMLNDKAVSLYRSNAIYSYVRSLVPFKLTEYPLESRRLMLEFMRRDHLSVLDILKVVMKGEVPNEWLCNLASMKGTEMKHEKARIFAVLTFELRQYFAITEDMIKEHLFKYNPHQTMTMNETDLLKKLHGLTSQMQLGRDCRSLNVIHIIDFSKWNLRMRYSNTCLVFKSIDEFLGTPGLIENTHIIFQQLLNVVQDPFNPPENHPSEVANDTIWRWHSCGWEGQRQKGWTLVTSALLSYIELVTGVSSEIIGQGDNQVLLSKFNVPSQFSSAREWVSQDPTGVRTILDSFYQSLEKECTGIGLKVKTGESCRSLYYLNYGKRLYFNGVELSMTLKRISKVLTEPNEGFPTTENRLKTLSGTIFAANLYSHPSFLPYLIGRIGVYLTLNEAYKKNPIGSSGQLEYAVNFRSPITAEVISRIMKIPSSLGGPPQQMLSSYLCRGHPDPLCADLVMVTLRAGYGDPFSKKLIQIAIKGDLFSNDKSKNSLIAAPFSLNLSIPQSARKPLQRQVKVAVSQYCKNADLRPMFDSSVDQLGERIYDFLGSIKPCHPLIINDIHSRTVPGRQAAFLSGLSNSTSLCKLLYEGSRVSITTEVQDLELSQLRHWRILSSQTSQQLIDPSLSYLEHHDLAIKLRELSWGCHLEGVTVPHPLGLFELSQAAYDVCSSFCGTEQEHIVIVYHQESLSGIHHGRGNGVALQRSNTGSPYLGNVINEGLTQIDYRADTPNSAWFDVLRLNTMKNWISAPGSEVYKGIENIIKTRTNVPLNIVDLASGQPSRLSYNHRAALMSTVRSCSPSTTTNIHTRMYVSSNRMGEFSRGEVNYHLPFGPSFLIAQSLISLDQVSRPFDGLPKTRVIYHYHMRHRNVPPVHDSLLETDYSLPTSQLETPKLLYAYQEQLGLTRVDSGCSSYLMATDASLSNDQRRFVYALQILSNSMMDEIIRLELMDLRVDHETGKGHNPITIGDMRLITPSIFLDALAWNLIFVLPLRFFRYRTPALFVNNVSNFIDILSKNFWDFTLSAFSDMKNLEDVLELTQFVDNTISAMRYRDVTQTVKIILARRCWSWWAKINSSVIRQESSDVFLIGSLNPRSTTAFLGKFAEICLQAVYPYCVRSESQFNLYGRCLVKNLHAGSDISIANTWEMITHDFKELASFITLGADHKIPDIKLVSLHHPWIDSLRSIVSVDENKSESGEQIDQAVLLPDFDDHEKLAIPLNPIWMEQEQCNCEVTEIPRSIPWHRYYQPAGQLSKSQYMVLELVRVFDLNVNKVLVVGSESGSEASAISQLRSCAKVYHYCPSYICDFSPHTAGSYVLSSFLVDGCKEKLIRPSSVALCAEVNQDFSIDEMWTSHLENSRVAGCFMNLTGERYREDDSYQQLIKSGLTYISNSTDCEWLVIMRTFRCGHEIEKLVSLFGGIFLSTDVVRSKFSPHRQPVFSLVFYKRRGESLAVNNSNPDCVMMGLKSAASWTEKIFRASNEIMAPCLRSNSKKMKELSQSLGVTRSGFQTAMEKLVPGLGGFHDSFDDLSRLIRHLEEFERSFIKNLMESYKTSTRMRDGRTILRTGILEARDLEKLRYGDHKLPQTLVNVKVLLILLRKQDHNHISIMKDILKVISSTHKLKISGNFFINVDLDMDYFLSNQLPLILEVVGTIFRWKSLATEHTSYLIYHKAGASTDEETHSLKDLFKICVTPSLPVSRGLWRWELRSFYLALLFICHTEEACDVKLEDGLKHLWTEEHLLKCKLLKHYTNCSNSRFLWLKDVTLESLNKLNVGDWCSIKNCDLPMITDKFCVCEMFLMPWTGLPPARVLVKISAYGPSVKFRRCYVDSNKIMARVNLSSQVKTGCCCYNCNAECFIMSLFGLKFSELDGMCNASLDKETIMTRWHVNDGLLLY